MTRRFETELCFVLFLFCLDLNVVVFSQMEEIRVKQEALKASEDRFKQTLADFDANKKKMEAVMAQFSAFKT